MFKRELERKKVNRWAFTETNKDLVIEKFGFMLTTHWADEEREGKLFSVTLLN